jgi:hypothetical protein
MTVLNRLPHDSAAQFFQRGSLPVIHFQGE